MSNWIVGILEEFMRDALFIVIKENISNTNKMKDNGIKRISIQKDELVSLALERSRNDIDHLSKTYREFLNIDLKSNKKFSKLFDMRKKRNVMAHSGFLFGYESPSKKKKGVEDFEKEVLGISDSAGMEFIMAEPIVDEKGNKTMPDSWHAYDPTEAKSSKKLEDDFCRMAELVWELGYFISTKLFIKKKGIF